MSCLLFRMRSLSALISSSMLSLMRLASASLCSLATRSCSVSEVGGLRKAEKGSPSALLEWMEGGLGVEIIAEVGRGGREVDGSREALCRGRCRVGRRERAEREAGQKDL